MAVFHGCAGAFLASVKPPSSSATPTTAAAPPTPTTPDLLAMVSAVRPTCVVTVALLPGSTVVLNRDTSIVEPCSPALCPLAREEPTLVGV